MEDIDWKDLAYDAAVLVGKIAVVVCAFASIFIFFVLFLSL